MRTIFFREFRLFIKILPKIIIAGAMLPFLLLITFGNIVGKTMPFVEGIDYMTFVSCSLSVITAMVVSTFVTGFDYQSDIKGIRTIEELVATPIPTWKILLGKAMGHSIKGVFVGGFFILLTILIGSKVQLWWGLILVVIPLFLTGTFFSLISTIFACVAKTYDEMAAMLNMVVFPFMLLSHTFFSFDMLPQWAAKLIYVSPLYYSVEIFRAISLRQLSSINLVYMIISLVYLILILLIATSIFNKKVKQ